MNAAVEIFRRPSRGNEYGFDPVTGGLTIPDGQGGEKYPELVLLYRGRARLANNKDWRARVRTQRGDMGTDHAIRVQTPIRECPPIHANDLVRPFTPDPDDPDLGHLVMGDPELGHYLLHVRNPLMSSNAWPVRRGRGPSADFARAVFDAADCLESRGHGTLTGEGGGTWG
jgi:hypothetical protein